MPGAIFFLSSFFFVLATSAKTDGELKLSGNFCVQSFNVYGPAYARNVEGRLVLLAEEVLKAPCEVLQFQEFWRESHFNSFSEKIRPARLAAVRADSVRADGSITGLASYFAGNVLQIKAERFQVNNSAGFLDWIRDVSGVQKGFTLVETRLDHGLTAIFLNLHTHPSDPAIRTSQIFQLVEAVAFHQNSSELPVILAGDINTTPGSLEMSLLEDLLLLKDSFLEKNGTYAGICTYCGDNPLSWSSLDRVIDFVLYREAPEIRMETIGSQINLQGEKNNPLSDHYGVRSILSWERRDQPQLLTPQDPKWTARLTKAISTLKTARSLLQKKSGDGFRKTAERMQVWESAFERGIPPGALLKIFQNP